MIGRRSKGSVKSESESIMCVYEIKNYPNPFVRDVKMTLKRVEIGSLQASVLLPVYGATEYAQ